MNPLSANQIELRDIHLPDPVSWWPLAPGWWFLMILIIFFIAASIIIIPKLIKKMKHQPARKLSLVEFEHIHKQYKTNKNKQQLAQSLSKLLRRICMTYDSRQNIAGLTGQAWINTLSNITLNEKNKEQIFSAEQIETLLTAPYKNGYDYSAQELLGQCESWIKNLPKEAQQ